MKHTKSDIQNSALSHASQRSGAALEQVEKNEQIFIRF